MDNFSVLSEKIELIVKEVDCLNEMLKKCFLKNIGSNNQMNSLKSSILTKAMVEISNNIIVFKTLVDDPDFEKTFGEFTKLTGISAKDMQKDILLGMLSDLRGMANTI